MDTEQFRYWVYEELFPDERRYMKNFIRFRIRLCNSEAYSNQDFAVCFTACIKHGWPEFWPMECMPVCIHTIFELYGLHENIRHGYPGYCGMHESMEVCGMHDQDLVACMRVWKYDACMSRILWHAWEYWSMRHACQRFCGMHESICKYLACMTWVDAKQNFLSDLYPLYAAGATPGLHKNMGGGGGIG